MTTFEVSFEEELCCDSCNQVIRFYLDQCPVCNKKFALTSEHWSVQECIKNDDGVFSCKNCNSVFKIIKYDYCNEPEATIELLNPQTP